MSTPIRIKDDVYSRLESSAKGYETVSDTIRRSIEALEVLESFEMMRRQIELSIKTLKNGKIKKEITLLVHYSEESKSKAIEMINYINFGCSIHLKSEVNCIRIMVSEEEC